MRALSPRLMLWRRFYRLPRLTRRISFRGKAELRRGNARRGQRSTGVMAATCHSPTKKSLKIPSVANCRARFSRLLISFWWICRLLCLCVWARACVEKGMRTEWSLISNRGGLRIPQKGNLISSLSQAGQIDSKLVSHDSLLKKSLVYTADYWCIKQWDG